MLEIPAGGLAYRMNGGVLTKTINLKVLKRDYDLDRYLANGMLEHIDDVFANLGNTHTFCMSDRLHWGSRPYDEGVRFLVNDLQFYLYSLAGKGRFGITGLRWIADEDYEWNTERNKYLVETLYWRCTLKPAIQVTFRRKLLEIRTQLTNNMQFLD